MVPEDQQELTFPEFRALLTKRLAGHVRVPLEDGSARAHVVQTGEVVLVDDYGKEERFNKPLEKFYITQTLLVAPIVNDAKQVMGVIEMTNKIGPSGDIVKFTEVDRTMVELLCEHCATFIKMCSADPHNP
mmetsp:Transcript_138555/g.312006  ORF Transcript_138555/g.312006 Transcript_138555/m.312006 type:complete len:131 (+) Transcript_138555:190-582(+)